MPSLPSDLELEDMFRRVSTSSRYVATNTLLEETRWQPRFRDGDILQHQNFQYRAVCDSYIHCGEEMVDVVTYPNEGMPITRNNVRLFKEFKEEKPKKGGLTAFLEKHS